MILFLKDEMKDLCNIFYSVKTEWLDGRHVVFGQIVDGMDVVKKIEGLGSRSGKTSRKVVIEDCGEID